MLITRSKDKARPTRSRVQATILKGKPLAWWAEELDLPYSTMHTRFRAALTKYCLSQEIPEPEWNQTKLPDYVVQYILRPKKRPPRALGDKVQDPMEGLSDIEILVLREKAKSMGISFRKIRSIMSNPYSREEILTAIRAEIEGSITR